MDETTLLHRSRRIIEEGWNRGELGAVDDVIAPHMISYGRGPDDGDGAGPDGVKAFIVAFRAGVADGRAEILHEAVRDGVVMQHIAISGTHTGPLFGLPATGNTIAFELANVDHYNGHGQIVEHWSMFDSAALMQQLGAFLLQPE